MIYVSDSGLLTIAGGKWTTYRAMAEETVDEAVKAFGLEGKVTNSCVTDRVRLIGSDGWSRNMFIGLTQRVCLEEVDFGIAPDCDVPSTVCQQMSRNIWRGTMGIELGQSARWLSRRGNCGHCMGFG